MIGKTQALSGINEELAVVFAVIFKILLSIIFILLARKHKYLHTGFFQAERRTFN